MSWAVHFTSQALADLEKVKKVPALRKKAKALLGVLATNPYQNPPPYEKLKGLEETCSRRLNKQHRLVYRVFKPEKEVLVLRMWTHYG